MTLFYGLVRSFTLGGILSVAATLSGCGGESGESNDARFSLINGAMHEAAATPQLPASDTERVFSLSAKTPSPFTTPKIYYIDSQTGSDSNDGTAPANTSAAIGPWRTLARVAATSLNPGDAVRLVCGRSWKETLKINSNGTFTAPIVVTTYPAGCTNMPIIDGGVSIAPNAWVPFKGAIYRAPLNFLPQLLASAGGHINEAHHPNRGYDTLRPTSPYLRNAADSNQVMVDGRIRSTYITSGPDLVLPSGATITSGTRVRIRTNAWVIDDTNVSTVTGARLTLVTPTEYFLQAGWGYYFLGRQWMLDSPGEWFHDSIGGQLYVWMPDSVKPKSALYAVQLAVGVDLQSRSHIQLDGLAIRYVGKAINARNSLAIVVRNSKIEDTAGMGIDAAESDAARFEGNTINRTGSDAISGADNNSGVASGMHVINNRITNSGVFMNGETVVSLPRRSYAAIRSGLRSVVTGNRVLDAGNIGIKLMAGSTVSGNYVRGACSVLDDCGAIYTSGLGNNSLISNNIVEHSRGALDGKALAVAYTQAQGIYLDESAAGVTVSGNTVTNADNGIHLHIAANNTIKDNKLYGNRSNQLWLQETSNKVTPSGDLHSNSVLNNQIVSTSPSSMGVLHSTVFTNTHAFATYDHNRYFDKVYPTISTERASSSLAVHTLPTWKAATNSAGLPRNLDPNGTGTSQLRYAGYEATGSSVIPNGKLTTDLAGWTSWNQTAPYGSMFREACMPGFCATYVAGASPGMISTPFFSVVAGQWYRVSLDIRAAADNQYQPVVVRNGGGGTAGYERISDVAMALNAGTTWKRFNFVFRATKTVIVNDPATGGKGARIDFEQTKPGTRISVSNVELVPVSSLTATTRTDLFVNASDKAIQITCPVGASAPALCDKYVKFSDDSTVTWPHYTTAMSTEIVYTLDRNLVDGDGDGVADKQDSCPATAAGNAVNAAGCALGQ